MNAHNFTAVARLDGLNIYCDAYEKTQFLGAFAKFRRATVSFVMTVRPSAWNNWAATGRIFMKLVILDFFEILLKEIQISLNSDKNNR
jgi:hypothetical protein